MTGLGHFVGVRATFSGISALTFAWRMSKSPLRAPKSKVNVNTDGGPLPDEETLANFEQALRPSPPYCFRIMCPQLPPPSNLVQGV